MTKKVFSIALFSFLLAFNTFACTNFLVTKGASVDGSTFITYAADSHVLYGELYYWAAADYPKGTMLDIYEWDTGKFLGKIKQVPHTYSVVGNMNEHSVAIGETTYGGRHELGKQSGAIMDYGSLIYVTLQRAKNAREAIRIIGQLMADYGYYSSGESFSIADPNEVWIMELIGKGEGEKGGVWVARKIPDGYISGHANQARITTFPYQKKNNFDDPKATCFNSPDVISFARKKGWYKGKDENFSFSDTYAPVDFGGARFCEIRVWAMFKDANSDMEKYFDYAKGKIQHAKTFADGTPNPNGYATNRMPLWIKPDRKVSVEDMMDFMRDHLEGTELDMSKDIGAGAFGNPYRWRPLTWKVDGENYCNERVTATQQTGFSFVAQCRNWLPNPIGGIFWFSVDDAASTVYFPMYCGATKVPEAYKKGNGNLMNFTFKSAFWITNMVSNLAYTRYSEIHPEIRAKQTQMENDFVAEVKTIDIKANELYKNNKQEGIKFITDYSVKAGQKTYNEWLELYKYLFTRYVDGNIKKVKNGKFIDNGNGKNIPASPNQPGYGKDWYKKIADETGEQLKMPASAGH